MLTIDGSMGEGGGQILRSSLALSLITMTPIRIVNIRANRSRPGLMRQHLTAVDAATKVGCAEVSGADVGSTDILFRPKAIRGGDYTFSTGSAGSTTLVFQTIFYPLLLASTVSSTVKFIGGTHNPMAPPVDFLQLAFLPILAKLGARADLTFERHGFYPAGGGAWSVTIHPAAQLARLTLLERGEILAQRATALLAQLSPAIGIRELTTLATSLNWDRQSCRPLVVPSHGPGNALLAIVESEHLTEVFTGFGERGVRAEDVATGVAIAVQRYLTAGVPVGELLADQLLLPMSLGSGGVFRTLTPSPHCLTQMELLKQFLGIEIVSVQESNDIWRIEVIPVEGRRLSARLSAEEVFLRC